MYVYNVVNVNKLYKNIEKTLFFEGAQKGLPDGLQPGGQK